MSFQEKKRESIKRYLLGKIREDDEAYMQKTIENFSVSVTTVKRYLKEYLEKHILVEDKKKKSGYALHTEEEYFIFENDGELFEDKIYYEHVRPSLGDITNEAEKIWDYAFTEMMNNAIEHSGAERIHCILRKDILYTEISIIDDGIGVFRNIQSFLENKGKSNINYQDIILELYKGKFTTNPETHSGEGIFFTSKVLKDFAIWSENTVFIGGVAEQPQLIQSHLITYYTRIKRIGTMVVMKLENQTSRKIGEVFDMFAPIDEGFINTVIPVKQACPYGEPIARSQARRMLERLDEFKKVELDFSGIEFMGQGFADEVFRVFQNKHPDIKMIPVNACPGVMRMVKHVTAGRKNQE